jgi:hydroxyethylthiazole kinase-like uncharacterized protein yjeF
MNESVSTMLTENSPSAGLPEQLYSAQQVRDLDACAINRYLIPGSILMERAGAFALQQLRRCWPAAGRLLVVCGVGNNAGDGYVLARLALQQGLQVNLLQLGDAGKLAGAAELMAGEYRQAGGRVQPYAQRSGDLLAQADVVVDAMLGTGLQRTLEGDWARVLGEMNDAVAARMALDIPSGLNADTGRVMGTCFEADVTVTFIGLKKGMFTGLARDYCGRILFSDLGVPAALYNGPAPQAHLIDWPTLKDRLPRCRNSAHKGQRGHVLVVGGAPGFSGAARLAAEGALRAGAGLVSLATHPQHAPFLNLDRPELMVHGVGELDVLIDLISQADVLVVGPGLGRDHWSRDLLGLCLAAAKPVVVDADGLNLLADGGFPLPEGDWVLTPHPGEAARLLGLSVEEIEQDRYAALDLLRGRYHASVVLKGAGSLIADASGPVAVCAQGNAGLATAGSGDVLAGVLGALLVDAPTAGEAARRAVCLHAAAGDAAARQGARGMLASDLFAEIRGLLA